MTDIEMNTYEINKLIIGSSPYKLVSMTIKSIDIPWSLLRFSWTDVKIEGVEIMLMPCPSKRSSPSSSDVKSDSDDGSEVKGK